MFDPAGRDMRRTDPTPPSGSYPLLLALLGILLAPAALTQTLQPFAASYRAAVKGLSSTVSSRLQQDNEGRWLLENHTSLFFFDFVERTDFFIQDHRVYPTRYEYRDEVIRFDWSEGVASVRDEDGSGQIRLPDAPVHDMLSFQVQLRLDLRANPQLQQGDYRVVDGGRLKNYQLVGLGQAQLALPAGKIDTLAFRLQRTGKNHHTLIWLAPALDYLPVKLERIDDNRSVLTLELVSVDSPTAP